MLKFHTPELPLVPVGLSVPEPEGMLIVIWERFDSGLILCAFLTDKSKVHSVLPDAMEAESVAGVATVQLRCIVPVVRMLVFGG